MIKRELAEVYMKALSLHKLSWKRRQEGKRPWFRKDEFDDSHLPFDLFDADTTIQIYEKLDMFVRPSMQLRDGSDRFSAVLTFREALILVMNGAILNVNYPEGSEVDLTNLMVMGNTFRIEIIE